MDKELKKYKEIKICSGPGCKAWAAEKIARDLETLEGEGYRVCRVACMKRCGGGATIRVSSRQVLKMRNPEEALEVFLMSNNTAPVYA